jgi:hypothetical protein
MPESKYGKYILTEVPNKPFPFAPWMAPGNLPPEEGIRVRWIDGTVLDGAFYLEACWLWPTKEGQISGVQQSHSHDYDQVVGFFGTDFENPDDLCGEIEWWLGDEKYTITKSCLAFVPKGFVHDPLQVIRLDRPVFHVATGPTKSYY